MTAADEGLRAAGANLRAARREIVRFVLLTPPATAMWWHDRRSRTHSDAANRHDRAMLRHARRGHDLALRYPSLMAAARVPIRPEEKR